MSLNVYWLQCGACGGDTMALLQGESPDIAELAMHDLRMLWHPSLSSGNAAAHAALLASIECGEQSLDVLCVEGAILRGPAGTGRFDCFDDLPKKDLVQRLAARARFVVAVGTCAAFGGVPADGPTDATGLCFERERRGGLLGPNFRAGSGMPVINLPGCPTNTAALRGTLMALASGQTLELDPFQAPLEWFGTLVHQGCTRNEYHEFRVEDADFGQRGCLYFHMGCLGPLTHGACNKHVRAESSATRVGVPCVGCARPDFPRPYPFFETRNIEGLPLDLPVGVDRAHFLAYKTMAAAAAPDRLRKRRTPI